MAQNTNSVHLIDQALRNDHAMIDELEEIVLEWDLIDENERARWTMDWDQFALSGQRELQSWYASRLMTPTQEAEYHRLLKRIEQNILLIRRFNLTMPRVPAGR
jgi:hypothetical protein